MLWKKIITLTLLLGVCLLTSCGSQYICTAAGESDLLSHHAPPSQPLTEITIGEYTYSVEWQVARKNDFTGKIVDSYRINPIPPDYEPDAESGNLAIIYPTIKVERDSGNITFFQHLTAFPLTGEITFASLQQIIEAHFFHIDFADFDTKTTREDDFSSTAGVKNGTYYIWEKTDENVSLTVYVDADGNLRDLSYAHAPAIGEKLSIRDEERDQLIEKKLKRMGLWENGITFTPEFLYYTQYRGKNAVIYQVHLVDKDGFSHGMHPIIIHE